MLCSSASDRGRFSYLGGRGGPLWQRISYKLPTPPDPSASPMQSASNAHPAINQHTPSTQLYPAAVETANTSRKSHHADGVVQPDSHSGGLPQPEGPSQQTSTQTFHKRQTNCGHVTVEDVSHHVQQLEVSLWDYLRQQLQEHKIEIDDETAQQLPFDFWGGYVGYLGYELKAECGGDNAHQAPTPDAAMFLADRYCLSLQSACPLWSTLLPQI